MKGHRLFDRFGFDLPEGSKVEAKGMQVVTNGQTIEYELQKHNWVDIETDEVLTNYCASAELSCMLDNCIDITKR